MTTSSSDGYIYVNYGHVENVEQALQDATQQIGAVLENLQSVISGLQASWSGVSETEYEAVQARWTSDMNQMNGILSQYSNTLSAMKLNTWNTDKGLEIAWSQIS
jgi:early secretory antigenic target protein ESAT-6